jgi:hypothetical protein
MLPILRTGEALVVGEAVGIPIRCLVAVPPENRRPDSADPQVVVPLGPDQKQVRPGGWREQPSADAYADLVTCWRNQNPNAAKKKKA